MKRTSISDAELESLCTRDEDTFYDRKSRRIAPGKLARTLSAFANTDGGELLVGVEDDGAWDGFPTVEEANALIAVAAETVPPTFVAIEALQHPGGSDLALLISVRRAAGICATPGGQVFVRRGAASVEVRGEDLEALKRAKGVVSFESQALQYPMVEITNSTTALEFCITAIPTTEPEVFLRKQGLINEVDRPSVAGTLLFHEEPQVHLPKAAVKIYRYRTEGEADRRYLDGVPLTIDGPLYDQITSAVAKTTEIIDSIPVMTSEGMQQVHYPPETLHEILTNAVLHRDYSINDDVHVRIFDNRVEVDSPGRLPAHITTANILDERFARNGTVVRLINRFPNPPNMDVGEGLNTAFQAMAALRLQYPEISETQDRVRVVIKHESLASPEQAIMNHVRSSGSINNGTARRVTGIEQERTIRRHFEELVAAGELVREGSGRGTIYRVPQ